MIKDCERHRTKYIARGIAVYLHAINSPKHAQYAEATNDADFYISAADLSDLREIEEIQPNRRLNRHQFIREGFEFDIYAKYQSNLRVPYDAVNASCDTYGGIQVACLEHLLVLKPDAFAARHASAHGRKDARDLIRLALVASEHPFQSDKASMFLDAEHLKLLAQVARGPEPTVLASGNAQLAKNIRATFSTLVATLR